MTVLNEQQVRAVVQSEMNQNNVSSRFDLNSIARHIHNGVDSPLAFQPVLTYVGLVGVGHANSNPVTVNLLPNGWTIDRSDVGVYSITHNLGTVFYSCVASVAQSTNVFAVPVIEGFSDIVYFAWLNVLTGAAADTGFSFSLTVINNEVPTTPSYYGTYTVRGFK